MQNLKGRQLNQLAYGLKGKHIKCGLCLWCGGGGQEMIRSGTAQKNRR